MRCFTLTLLPLLLLAKESNAEVARIRGLVFNFPTNSPSSSFQEVPDENEENPPTDPPVLGGGGHGQQITDPSKFDEDGDADFGDEDEESTNIAGEDADEVGQQETGTDEDVDEVGSDGDLDADEDDEFRYDEDDDADEVGEQETGTDEDVDEVGSDGDLDADDDDEFRYDEDDDEDADEDDDYGDEDVDEDDEVPYNEDADANEDDESPYAEPSIPSSSSEDVPPPMPTPLPTSGQDPIPTWGTSPSQRPVVYVPLEDDPLQQEDESISEEEEEEERSKTGGVGDYIYFDHAESFEEMEHDQNVAITVGVCFGIGFCLMIITAHQMMDNPGGCCASICRILVACQCAITRCVCFPCRYVCGCTGRSNQRYTSYSNELGYSRNQYSADLELT
eukprot:scaffold11043_cov122-Cylindrotheca_fusiformis.AAC.5